MQATCWFFFRDLQRFAGWPDASHLPRPTPGPSSFRSTARCRPRNRIGARALQPPESHPEHERRRNLAHDRGRVTVIDSGLARTVRYDGARGIDRWETARISRAAADRAGRAGRTGPGTCIRVWSEANTAAGPNSSSPKFIASTSPPLSSPWRLGHPRPRRVRLVDPPKPERIAEAERLLVLLGGAGRRASANHPTGSRHARAAGPSAPACLFLPPPLTAAPP